MRAKTKEVFSVFYNELIKAIEENKSNYRKMEDKIREIAKKYDLDVHFVEAGVIAISFNENITNYLPDDLPSYIGFSKRKLYINLVDLF
jgi:hypothetical protein